MFFSVEGKSDSLFDAQKMVRPIRPSQSLAAKANLGKEYAWPAGGAPWAEAVVARQRSEGGC